MSLQQIAGSGQAIWYPQAFGLAPSFVNSTAIAATGDKLALVGRVWTPNRGAKSIRKVGIRFGSAITKAGGSALTLSLQDVDLANGPPGRPDGTQDQTAAIANATIAANTWVKTGNLSADRSVNYGDRLAVVIEYDGSGRLGADSIVISNLSVGASSQAFQTAIQAQSISSVWTATNSVCVIVVFEFSDGTFGTLMGALPISAINTHTFKQDTGTADEYSMPFQLSAPLGVDGLYFPFAVAAGTADFSFILYQGTSPVTGGTVAIDAHPLQSTSPRYAYVPFSQEIALVASTQYYLSLQPTQTTSNVSVYSFDVAEAGHLACHPGGVNFNYATRLDAGSWAAATTTRRLIAGLSISSFDDGVGGGLTRPPGAMHGGMGRRGAI